MTDLGSEAIMRLLAQQVPAMARRAVPVPATRLASVAQTSDPAVTYVEVTVDGDADPISVLNGTGQTLASGQRVIVLFYPPHGAIVIGLLLPLWGPEQVWTTAYDVASSTTVSADSTGWTEVTPTGFGWTDAAGDLVCEVPGLWLVGLQAEFASNGLGTHRAAAMSDASATHHARVSAQFDPPGGTPTSGYGLSSGGWGTYDALAGDTLGGRARQDSGSTLAVTLQVHLRFLGPSA